MVDLSKRSWFNTRLHGSAPLRPPWSLDEAKFIVQCTRCDACVESCPDNLIKKGSGGFPELDFSKAECTFCQECVSACSDGALDLKQRPIIAQRPEIKSSCLTHKGIYCRSCADICDQSAILFKYYKDSSQPAIAQPALNLDLCNGCGACVSTCPTDAIQFLPAQQPIQQPAQENINYV